MPYKKARAVAKPRPKKGGRKSGGRAAGGFRMSPYSGVGRLIVRGPARYLLPNYFRV